MAELPTFFFSYSRRDARNNNRKLSRFFEDLEARLDQFTQGTQGVALGTFDRRFDHGGDWDDDLSRNLAANKALVTIASPKYFDSFNCGKEVAVFARRHPTARLDRERAIRHTSNILHIRWLPDTAYESNRIKDAVVPAAMRKITWTPADNGSNQARSRAIQRYMEKGMETCVKPGRNYYDELILAFVESIRNMPDLPRASFPVSWDSITSAFDPVWSDLPMEAPERGAATNGIAAPAAPLKVPGGPSDAVVFYLTNRPLAFDPQPIGFADRLVDGPGWHCSAPAGSIEPFLVFFDALQDATHVERLNDFHCACNPQIPQTADRLLGQLELLSKTNALVCLAVDPTLWLGSSPADAPARAFLDAVIESPRWSGPVVLPPIPAAPPLNIPVLLNAKSLRRPVIALPSGEAEMTARLRSVLVQERGRILNAVPAAAGAEAERVPVLHGPAQSTQSAQSAQR